MSCARNLQSIIHSRVCVGVSSWLLRCHLFCAMIEDDCCPAAPLQETRYVTAATRRLLLLRPKLHSRVEAEAAAAAADCSNKGIFRGTQDTFSHGDLTLVFTLRALRLNQRNSSPPLTFTVVACRTFFSTLTTNAPGWRRGKL